MNTSTLHRLLTHTYRARIAARNCADNSFTSDDIAVYACAANIACGVALELCEVALASARNTTGGGTLYPELLPVRTALSQAEGDLMYAMRGTKAERRAVLARAAESLEGAATVLATLRRDFFEQWLADV